MPPLPFAHGMAAPMLAAALLAPVPAPAQTAGDPPPGATGTQRGTPPADWRLAIGAGAVLRPAYLGSDTYVGTGLPQIDLRYRDIAFLSTFGGLPGVGVNALRGEGLLAGPVLRLRFPRDEGANAALRGLGDVGWVPEAGVFLDYRATWFRAAAEVRAGLGDHTGAVGDFRLEGILRPWPGLTLSAGPRLSLGSRDFVQTYFGVTPGQARRSGLAPYRPASGLTSVGAGLFANQAVTEQLSVQFVADYARLSDPLRDSPIVRDANQWVVGLSATYAFSW